MQDYKIDGISVKDAIETAKFIISATYGSRYDLVRDRLQCLLDEEADRIVELNEKVLRQDNILRHTLETIENRVGTIIGSDIEEEIGITQEEYDEIMNG